MWPKYWESLQSARSLSVQRRGRNEEIPIAPWSKLDLAAQWAGTNFSRGLVDSTRENRFWSQKGEVKINGLFNHKLLPSHPFSSQLRLHQRFRASQNQSVHSRNFRTGKQFPSSGCQLDWAPEGKNWSRKLCSEPPIPVSIHLRRGVEERIQS